MMVRGKFSAEKYVNSHSNSLNSGAHHSKSLLIPQHILQQKKLNSPVHYI